MASVSKKPRCIRHAGSPLWPEKVLFRSDVETASAMVAELRLRAFRRRRVHCRTQTQNIKAPTTFHHLTHSFWPRKAEYDDTWLHM